MRLRHIYIDAGAILGEKQSGVGHALLETLREIDKGLADRGELKYSLIVPFHKLERVRRYGFQSIRIQPTFMTGKVMAVLSRFSIPILLSLFRPGVYIFPNYRNFAVFPPSKTITYIHDMCFDKYPEMVEENNLRMLQRYVPLWLRRTQRIVTVSNTSKQEIGEAYPDFLDKIRVVKNGVDGESLAMNTPASFQAVRERYGIPKKFFLFLSNIEPRKNIDSLLDAYLNQGVDFSKKYGLVLVGADGWKSNHTLERIAGAIKNGYNIVHPSSYVSDEERDLLLSNAMALIQPSYHEGFSMPPLEAMAAGTPVIVSDIPVHHEIVGKFAVSYIDPYRAESLAQAMKKIVENDIDIDLQEAQRYANSLGWDISARALQRVIGEVV